jgi:hypothetical protein
VSQIKNLEQRQKEYTDREINTIKRMVTEANDETAKALRDDMEECREMLHGFSRELQNSKAEREKEKNMKGRNLPDLEQAKNLTRGQKEPTSVNSTSRQDDVIVVGELIKKNDS